MPLEATGLLIRDEARPITVNVAKLPGTAAALAKEEG